MTHIYHVLMMAHIVFQKGLNHPSSKRLRNRGHSSNLQPDSQRMLIHTVLVGGFNPSEKYESVGVSWDDDIPN